MSERTQTPGLESGRIPKADRIQRLLIGVALLLLNVSGLYHRIEWRGVVALVLQVELLVTALAGWCPVYWACRLTESGPDRIDN